MTKSYDQTFRPEKVTLDKGQRFAFGHHTYYIDTIGPVTTLTQREDGVMMHVQTERLKAYLEAQ